MPAQPTSSMELVFDWLLAGNPKVTRHRTRIKRSKMNNCSGRCNSRPFVTHMLRGNILANKLKADGDGPECNAGKKLSEPVKLSLKELLGFKNVYFSGGG